MDATTAFGLGATSLGTSVLLIVGAIIAKGLRSKCVVAGNVLAVDIHRQTAEEVAADADAQAQPQPQQTIINIPAIPIPVSVQPTRIPTPRDSHGTIKAPRNPSKINTT